MSSEEINSLSSALTKTQIDGPDFVSFAGRGLKLNDEKDAVEVVTAIQQNPSLEALRLDGNTLGIDAAKAIGDALSNRQNFKRALWSDMFTGRMKTEIPPALKHLGDGIMAAGAQLVELDLSDNAFGPNGMKGLVDLLPSASCFTLQILKLNNNGLGPQGGKMLAECLNKCHEASSAANKPLKLRVFVSGRGRLENEGAKALSKVFEAMGSLEEISMPQNGINHEGIEALAHAFSFNPSLRSIDLSDNTFIEKGALAMAKALPSLQLLEKVNFADCLIRTKGAQALASALKDGHTRLKELLLSHNEIKLEGGLAISDAILNKKSLTRIDLDGNEFGSSGVEKLKEFIDKHSLSEQFGSLSEDEGSSEEDENDEGGDKDNDAEESPQEEEEGEEIDDPALQIQGVGLTPRLPSASPSNRQQPNVHSATKQQSKIHSSDLSDDLASLKLN